MEKIKDSLIIIPARGGSKGLPGKNTKELNKKPLIYYTIDAARQVADDVDICVSTDDDEIRTIVENYDLQVCFKRPDSLASDTANSRDVVIHAYEFYRDHFNRNYKKIILLQPTSPLRNGNHLLEAYNLWDERLDMLVSVTKSKDSPFFNLLREDLNGYLTKYFDSTVTRRQDLDITWKLNGAIYIYDVDSYLSNKLDVIKGYEMDAAYSVDIDDQFDFDLCEYILNSKLLVK